MGDSEPTTQTLEMTEVARQLGRLVNVVNARQARILVEEAGVPVAAIISVDDLERFVRLEREREERFAVIDRMREAFLNASVEEIEQETQRSIAEAQDRLRKREDELAARST